VDDEEEKGEREKSVTVLSVALTLSGSLPASVTQDDFGFALPREFRKPLATSNHYSRRERGSRERRTRD